MKELSLSEISEPLNGKYTSDRRFNGVYTDSRKPVKDGLFVCLSGERFDGHDYIKNAEEDGAAAVMCSKKADTSLPVIYVNDTRKALLDLSSYYRSLFDLTLIGVTGSVGKTTAKEMTALVMSSEKETVKTRGNLNNDIGLPMTLFNIEESTQAAVVEMGMNHQGEIARLTEAAKPDCAVITNIGVSHIENLGSRENILKAKLEITQGMKKGSDLILNGDNDLLSAVRADDFNVIFFGIDNKNCLVRAENIRAYHDRTVCDIVYKEKSYETVIPAAGLHNVYNALAAFTAGVRCGISPENASGAIKNYTPEGMRQKTTKKKGITFIEDCYNASPDSVKAGIDTLMITKAERRIAVLGDMLELGDYGEKAHGDCGKYAAEKGADMLFAYGEASRNTARKARENGMTEVFEYTSPDSLASKLFETLKQGDAALFKASRGMKLENVLYSLYEKYENK